MHERTLFEYAVLRVVPQVEREEFLNVGVVVFCPAKKFLACRWELNADRLRAFSGVADWELLQSNLRSFESICNGAENSGAIGLLDTASRFRWLTAARSTVIQVSKVHPGFCTDPHEKLDQLFNDLVSVFQR